MRVADAALRTLAAGALLLAAGCSGDAPTGPDGELPEGPLIDPGPYVAGESYFGRNDYVEYVAGNGPVILSAPHGGDLEPSEIPDRTATSCPGSPTTVRDRNTRELALTMQARFFAAHGIHPHVVIVHLRRTKLDANRPLAEAACGSPAAEIAWRDFHAFLEIARETVVDAAGRGWYMDLHGHGHLEQRLELGYLLRGSLLDLSDAELDANPAYEDSTSIKTLSEEDTGHSFAELLRGATSLGSLYADRGFPAVPAAADPSPGAAPYFSGGYNTLRYGCGVQADEVGGVSGGPVCGVQVEANYTGVRDSAANRIAFANATVAVLAEYLSTHWGIELGAAGVGTAP